MLPILLISSNKRTAESFIKKYIKDEHYSDLEVSRIVPEKTIITIDQLRAVQSTLIRTSKQLIIIYDFDTARIESQNAFLKTLEEHSSKIQFILVCSSIGGIIETVISRCRVVKTVETSRWDVSTISSSEKNSLTDLLLQYSDITKEKAIKLCDAWLSEYHSSLSDKENSITFIKELMVTRNGILKNNFNPQMAIDHLLILKNKYLK